VRARSRPRPRRSRFLWPNGLGKHVIEYRGPAKGYSDRLLIADLTFQLRRAACRRDRGANGAGKTTLFSHDTGQEKRKGCDHASVRACILGMSINSVDSLDGKKRDWEEIPPANEQDLLGKRESTSAAIVLVQFKGADQQKKVGSLSSGERNRVHLARCSIRRQCIAASTSPQRPRR